MKNFSNPEKDPLVHVYFCKISRVKTVGEPTGINKDSETRLDYLAKPLLKDELITTVVELALWNVSRPFDDGVRKDKNVQQQQKCLLLAVAYKQS